MQPQRLSWVTVAVLVLVVASGGFYLAGRLTAGSSEPGVPSTELRVKGLSQRVDLYRDAKGTPHIFASNDADLFRAFDYVSGEDRLFQIDYMRRVVSGRLAEIRGEAFVKSDTYFRTLGLRQLSEQVAVASDAETRRILDAFSEGVNAYIASHRDALPVEFGTLGYAPEPWTAADSILVWKTLAHALDLRRWETDAANADTLIKFGKDAEQLLPASDTAATIVQEGEMPGLRPRTSTEAALAPVGLNTDDAQLGSNNWVIAGTRTTTGKPLLASEVGNTYSPRSGQLALRLQF